VEAYRPAATGAWHTVLPDGYYHQHLLWHLKESGYVKEVEALLLDFRWLVARLQASDVWGVLSDCALCPDNRAVEVLCQALNLSLDALCSDKAQVAGQILGRLTGFRVPELQKLVEAARDYRSTPWLRPLNGNVIRCELERLRRWKWE
jgi:hypothetical protein